ncbi:hypothetical protein ABZ567_30195 [Streptomyces sp. NPDC016459]|uniref:hypothetical protein n=1 Tax=Streptomyces sp. NPDC016459 TaxID=3157190 RepID=UPI0033D8573D
MVAERVLRRLYEQEAEATAAEQNAGTPRLVQVAGRSVLKVPHRSEVADASALPVDYQRMLQIVKAAGGPMMVKEVGAELGIDASVPGWLEPLRGKLSKLPRGAGCTSCRTAPTASGRDRPAMNRNQATPGAS